MSTDRGPESITRNLAFLSRPARRPRAATVQLEKLVNPSTDRWRLLERRHSPELAAGLIEAHPDRYRIAKEQS